jgi:hypothetical protein
MDEWFFNPKIRSILQSVIQVFTLHPRPLPVEGHKKIHTTASHVIINRYFILLTVFWHYSNGFLKNLKQC